MGLQADYYYICDECAVDTGDSRPTVAEAKDYAERGGWYVGDAETLCDLCAESSGL